MPDRPIEEPWVLPQRLEAGVSGIPKTREWDEVRLIDVAALGSDAELAEFDFILPERGEVRIIGLDSQRAALVSVEIETATRRVARPAEGRMSRVGPTRWSVAARHVPGATLELDVPGEIDELSVAVPPDGDRIQLVDGEELVDAPPRIVVAFEQLEVIGSQRSRSFVALAQRLDDRRFTVRTDPL